MSAPVVDATSSTFNVSAPSSLTWSHTIGAVSNRLLMVAVIINKVGITVSGVTYGGVSLSKVANITCTTNSVANQSDAELWSLTAPATGTANIVATFSAASTEAFAAGLSLSNVNQASPLGTPATIATSATPQSITVSPTTTNQIVMDSVASNNSGFTVAAGQTAILHQLGNQIYSGSSYKTGTASTTTMSWTVSKNDTYGQVAVAINGVSPSRTIPTSAALKTTNTRTIPDTAALKTTNTRTIADTSALKTTNTRTVPSSAALKTTNARTVPDTAALRTTNTRTISGTAALKTTNTRAIPDTAALLQTSNRTIPTTTALLATQKRTLPGTAALLTRNTRTISTYGALLQTSTRTIGATAALIGNIRTIPCSAALSAPFEPNAMLIVPSGQTTLLVSSGQTSLIVPGGQTTLIIQ